MTALKPCRTAAVCATMAVLAAGTVHAQTYSLTSLLDQNTPRPDGQGNFNIDWPTGVADDGTHIAFINFGASDQEIWISNPGAGSFTKLIDTTARAPGGTGKFSSFVPPNNNVGGLFPKIANGKLFFWAEDATGNNGYGLYWVALTGGAAHHVVNYKDAAPEGGTFGFINSFFVSGNNVLFNTGNVYVGFASGAAPVVVADQNTQILIPPGPNYYGCYSGAAISGETVAVTASNCFDPSRGLNVIFVGPYTNFASSANKLPVVNSNQTLPGDTFATPHLDVISDNIFLNNNLLYFGAQDTFATSPLYGYYNAPFGPGGTPLTPAGSPIYRVFDNVSAGLTGGFGNFGNASFAQGTLAFLASNTSSGTGGFYIASGPVPTLLTTDLQRGVGQPPGFSGGRMAFGGAGFFDSQLDYVTPSACGVTPNAQITVKKGPITAGSNPGEYLQTVTLRNAGPAITSGSIDLVLTRLTAGYSLVNQSGVTACTAPVGSPFLTASVPTLAHGGKTSLTLDVVLSTGTSFAYTPTILTGTGTP